MAGSCVGDSSRSFGGHAGSSGVGQITVVYMDAKINNIHIFFYRFAFNCTQLKKHTKKNTCISVNIHIYICNLSSWDFLIF